MISDNFYILLELPFDPPATDSAQIKAAIHSKHTFWTQQLDNPQQRGVALQQLELIPTIEETMLDPEKREEEAKKAIELRHTMFSRFVAELRVLEAKNYILPKELNTLGRKYFPYGISRSDIHKELLVPVTETPPKTKASKRLRALPLIRMHSHRDNLAVLKVKDLYAFLRIDPNASKEELLRSANLKYQEAFQTEEKTPEVFSSQVLAEAALALFENDEDREQYKLALTVDDYPELNDLLDEEFQRATFISTEALVRLVNFGVSSYGKSVLEVEDYIRRFCEAYGISVDFMHQHIECPSCHEMNSGRANVCSACAQPLKGQCPSCGAPFENGAANCHNCGFSIAGMAKAIKHLEAAETAIVDGNWSVAKRSLEHVQTHWPFHPKIFALKEKIDELEARNMDFLQTVDDYIKENRYYAAQSLLEEAKLRQIYFPATTIKQVESTIASFEEKIEALRTKGGASYASLNDMLSHVSDSIDLERMLAQYPPEPPSRILVNSKENQVLVDWNSSNSSGVIQYVLVRKENSVPLTAYDGDVLYEGNENSFIDTSIPPLRNFYYSVFVKRGSSYSDFGAVAPAPVMIIPELTDLRILPADSGAQLTWKNDIPSLTKVNIWRKLGGDAPSSAGDGMELETERLDGFTDMKLKNGVDYWYFITATYQFGGISVTSAGIRGRITPQELVSPIDQLTVTRTLEHDDGYFAHWEGSPHKEFMLLLSFEKPRYYSGEVVKASDLLFANQRLDLENQTSNSARFHYEFSGGVYIIPVIISGKFGIVGNPRYVINIADVKSPTYKLVAKDIFIHFEWPKGIATNEVTIAWKTGSYPSSVEEDGISKITCTRRQYELEYGAHIPDISEDIYYFRVFTAFVTPENTTIYSTGTTLLVDNSPYQEIRYAIKYSKPLFSSNYTITLTLSSATEFTIPNSSLVGKEERLPLRITDGSIHFEVSHDKPITGSISYTYKAEKYPSNFYFRMFFCDEENYKKYRLLPKESMRLT